MKDYKAWLDELSEFIFKLKSLPGESDAKLDILPPATDIQIAKVEANLLIELPISLKHFLKTASSGVNYQYSWKPEEEKSTTLKSILFMNDEINGEGLFCNLNYFEEYRSIAIDRVELCPIYCYEEAAFWGTCFPFFEIGNGDMLALHCPDFNEPTKTDWPVAYLDHDFCGSRIIEKNFDSFMQSWSYLMYIRLFYIRDYLINPATQTIGLNSEWVKRLRSLFLD